MSALQPCSDAQRAGVRALLAACRLPLAGLDDHWATLWVAVDSGQVVGCVALEVYPGAALLRSLAVAPAMRGQGLGERLLQHALAAARTRNLASVVLLTETAEAFFAGRGFERTSRAAVPAVLLASAEFRGACPQSAVVLQFQPRSNSTAPTSSAKPKR